MIRGRLRLVLLSFLMLFLELALIRWGSENVLYLNYFSNLLLLASFLGIGVGFLSGGRGADGFRWAPVALLGFVVFVSVFPVHVTSISPVRVLSGFGSFPPLPLWIELPAVFVGAALVMGLVAQGVAHTFREFPSLDAYRLDITGSLLGIIAFTGLQFIGPRPLAWGLVVAVLFLLTVDLGRPRWISAAVVGFVVVLGFGSFGGGQRWSPYYRVETLPAAPAAGPGAVAVDVNGRPHQTMVAVDQLARFQHFYLEPYEHLVDNPLNNVLIIGAGTGNDVAVALAHGAKHIDAVEIDPVLQELGADLHPNHPYDDPRVNVIINDGRAFLQSSQTKYDLILLALPDSLTLISGQGSLRLESYLLTKEAMQAAKDRLAPDGAFAMYNYYLPVSSERFAETLQEVYGHPPCAIAGDATASGDRQQAVYMDSLSPDAITCDTPWVADSGGAPQPATDDHPFPYLAGRTIPAFYLVALALILGVSIVAVRSVSGPLGRMRSYVDLFFMGAAFLLLETKSVVQFALLFGSTWLVNALVFAGVLVAVLLAISVAKRAKLPNPWVLYGVLLIALVVAWLVPPALLLGLPSGLRFVAAITVSFAPIFLANLVFAQRFKDVGDSTVAFGANLLGAMLGGVLEYMAITVGYRNLLIVAAVLYGLAWFTGRRVLRRTPA